MITYTYTGGLAAIVNGDIDFDSDDIRIALVDEEYIVDVDTHDNLSDVLADVTVTGVTMTVTVVRDNTNRQMLIKPADVLWSSLTASGLGFALIYKHTGTASTSTNLFLIDFESTYAPVAQDFSVLFSGGVLARMRKG